MSAIDKIGNEKLEDLFLEKFESQVASRNGLASFDVKCERNVVEQNKADILISVNVTGMAGDPTLQDWLNGKVEDCGQIELDTGRQVLLFTMDKKACSNLSLIDYVIGYKFSK